MRIVYWLFFLLPALACEKNDYQIFGTGTFEATEILISAQTPGQLLSVDFEEGQTVTAGQVLARIDVEKISLQQQQIDAMLEEVELSAALATEQEKQARIQYENLKTRFDRFTNLLKENSIPQQQYDDLKSQLEIAERNLKSVRLKSQTVTTKQQQLDAQNALLARQLKDGIITAPADGTILQQLKQAGEVVGMGTPVAQLANLAEMEITTYVAETDLGKIKVGEALSIQVDAFPEKLFTGRISWISPKAEFTPKNVQTKEARTNLVYAIKLKVANPNGELKIGMPADIFRR
jgi:HlyD family secretion protein